MMVRKVLSTIAVASVTTIGGVAISASPAAAYPNLCTIPNAYAIWGLNGGAQTICQMGTGYYHVKIFCAYDPLDNVWYPYSGKDEYVGSGKWSFAYCPPDQYFITAQNVLNGPA